MLQQLKFETWWWRRLAVLPQGRPQVLQRLILGGFVHPLVLQVALVIIACWVGHWGTERFAFNFCILSKEYYQTLDYFLNYYYYYYFLNYYYSNYFLNGDKQQWSNKVVKNHNYCRAKVTMQHICIGWEYKVSWEHHSGVSFCCLSRFPITVSRYLALMNFPLLKIFYQARKAVN